MKKILFLLLLSGLVLSSCNRRTAKRTTKKPTSTKVVKKKGVDFKKDVSFASVLKKAKAENKPIFIDFYTTWCGPCKFMDETVFELEQVGDLFNENFINIKVNPERDKDGPMLASQFGVVGYPMLVYLDSNGDVVDSILGAAGATAIMDKARRTITHNNAINGAGSR